MKKLLAIIGILVLFVAGYLLWAFKFRTGAKKDKGPEPVPLAVSKHSDGFNQSAEQVLSSYYDMTEAFVNWDSVKVNTTAASLQSALEAIKIDELQPDTAIYQSSLDPLANAKAQVALVISEPTLEKKRVALNTLSENLRLLMVIIKYDRAKMYWQECPMAFGEDNSGFWLSKSDVVRNPYMGLKHPTYKDDMLQCGGPKDTINFTVPLLPANPEAK
ncbi:MAG: DUF3347 domain-containing protein [Chitinophagaceae bacterium]|nr:MAG: DUF3347 domain-containing protein [Chitinophagaceae bacterium]